MNIYLREDLLKSSAADKAKKDSGEQKNQVGEARGGQYVARLQIGYEKDGSPRYKYFKTLEERDKYLQGRGKAETKRSAKKLKDKVKKEQDEHSAKEKATRGKVESGKLFVSDGKDKKDDKDEDKVSKGFPHFIWRLDI